MNNERIKKFAEQCEGMTICECGSTGFDYEKFSKLIIEECVKEIQYFVALRIPASEYPMKLKSNMGVQDDINEKQDKIRESVEKMKSERDKITEEIIRTQSECSHIRAIQTVHRHENEYGYYTGQKYTTVDCPDCDKHWRN